MSEQKFCYKYPHPSVTADCVIFGFDGVSIKVLLIQRGIEPFKDKWAFPGGFMKIDETAEDAASARWFAMDEVPSLAFDHDRILQMAVNRLKERRALQTLPTELQTSIASMQRSMPN